MNTLLGSAGRSSTSEAWELLAKKAYKINRERQQLTKEYDNLMQEILALAGNADLVGKEYEVKRTTRLGSIDYKLVPELRNINLEPYRKEAVMCWKIEYRGNNETT